MTWAMAYTLAEELGLKVFPCRPDKRPYTRHGFKDASSTMAQLEAWESEFGPDALVGVPTGAINGLAVIDIDPEGQDWYWAHQEQLGSTCTHLTPRGRHLLYSCRGQQVLTSAGVVAKGVDTRGEGGYIVWWPAEGHEVLNDGWLPWPLGNTRERPKPTADPYGQTGEGSRNARLYSIARGVLRKNPNLSERDLNLIVWGENQESCVPPLPRLEVGQIVRSARSRGQETDAPAISPISYAAMKSYADSLPDQEVCLGPFRTGQWGIIAAPPGAGKSLFALAIGKAMATGQPLGVWPAGKPRQVVLVDAEMSMRALVGRLDSFGTCPDTLQFVTTESLMMAGQDPLSIGLPAVQAALRGMTWDVLILDNIEYLLDPVPGGDGNIWDPSTWKQMHPFVNWCLANNKLLIFIDHTNKAAQVQGSTAKQKGASFVFILTPDELEPGDYARFYLDRSKYRDKLNGQPQHMEWIASASGWQSRYTLTRKEKAREMKADGASNAEIAEALGVEIRQVQKYLKS
jgi:hypothetical protein